MEAVTESVRANTFTVHINDASYFSPVQYGLLRLAQHWPEAYAWNADYWDRIDPYTQARYTLRHALCTKSKDLHDSARLLHGTVPRITLQYHAPYLVFTPSDHAESFEAITYLRNLPLWRPS